MKHHFGFHALWLVLVLISPLVQAATDCAAVTEIPSTECEALVAFYNSTSGHRVSSLVIGLPIGLYSKWNVTNMPCSWSGVTCSGGHVSKLELVSDQLTGSIPKELGKLTNLTGLNLYDNQLTGSIPKELGKLTNLESLELDFNQLTGTIPTELGNLSNLEYLYLYNNELTGTIPTELGNLSNLEALSLSDNQLTGPIPRELGNLTNLKSFQLSNNQLIGSIPRELGNLTNLMYLDLQSNQLTAPIPNELGNLSNLESIRLSNNQLCGEIPVELKNLSNIYLKLDNNHLTASDSELIAWLDSRNPGWETTQTSCPIATLQFLLTTYSVTENGGIVTITVIRVGSSNGAISANYATSDAAGNDYIQTTGTLYWADGDFANKTITITIIDDDKFENPETFTITLTEPASGEKLDITTVTINDNDPFDCATVTEIPATECEALISLYDSTNGANWRDNDGWNVTNMPCSWDGVSCSPGHVSKLWLYGNQLTGSIPTELGNLSNLKYLYLYNNQLTGSIPTELGNLSNLSWLDLSNNQLTGSIPTELGNLSNLSWLDLSNNQLTGTIPTELGNLSNLSWLDLSNNQLTGSIPTELGNLDRFHLHNNQLCGEIPVELKNLDLYDLNLNTNHLTTSAPELIKWLNNRNPSWKYTQTSCSTASVRFSSTIYSLGGNNGQVTVTVTRAGNEAISANYEYNQTTGTLYWAEGDLADKTITITIIDDGKPEAFTITLTSPVSGENLDNATIIINNLFDCTTVTEIPTTECQALIALYDSTGGARWSPAIFDSPVPPLGWIVTNTPCSWYGVECSEGHVTALRLAFTELVGFIPAELGNLSHLKTLQLGSTYDEPMLVILGGIAEFCGNDTYACPKAMGRMLYEQLIYVENHLSGPIPPELGKLSQLETFQLGVGNLSGPIPSELGKLSQLKSLELHYNELCGVIPAELKNLSSLLSIKLGNNRLTASDPELKAWLDEHEQDWETTQSSCSPQIDLEKDSYNLGELFQARLTEKLAWGYDLYAAVVMPDGNFFTLTKENEFAAGNTVAKWYGQRIADNPVMLLDLILPDNLPSGEYCLYGILSPKNKPVLETVDLWVWTRRCLFIKPHLKTKKY